MAAAGWAATVVLLFLATFGVWPCLRIALVFGTFIAGMVTCMYLAIEKVPRFTASDLLSHPLEGRSSLKLSIRMMSLMSNTREYNHSQEFEITSHRRVDKYLNEIIDAAIEEYLASWYRPLSSNDDFPKAVKHLSRSISAGMAHRIMSVNWVSHITGRVIEDTACHLRLFRSAGREMANTLAMRRPGSRAHSPARPNQSHHRRNKSDTDVASFVGIINQNYLSNMGNVYNHNGGSDSTLERKFFEYEFEMEAKKFCRENICIEERKKILFVAELSQMLVVLCLESLELRCNVVTSILRALISFTLTSTLDHFIDPDTLNCLFLRMASRDSLSTDSFINVIRSTDNVEELKATLALAQKEIHSLVSCDSGGECDISVKQQLSSLQYLTKLIFNRSSILTPTQTVTPAPKPAVTKLPLGFLLDNHLALCHFLDFAQSMNAHKYIFCYLSIESWRTATMKQISEMKNHPEKRQTLGANAKIAAVTIYDQYFAKDSHARLNVPLNLLDSFDSKRNSPFTATTVDWFDEIEECIQFRLEAVVNAFRNSRQYSRLLAELDIDENFQYENARLGEREHIRTGSTGDAVLFQKSEISTSHSRLSLEELPLLNSTQDPCRLEVVILETGLVQDRGKAYGVYALEVKRWDLNGRQHSWHVYRRYSDFYELNNIIKEAYPELGKMEFPSKKTFHNTSRNVLEHRMTALSAWISKLARLGSPGGPLRYAPLHMYLLPFLNPRGPQDKQPTVINSMLVQPLRQGMRTLKNVPEQLFNTMDDIVGGLSKFITKGSVGDASQSVSSKGFEFGSQWNCDSEELLPLRVILLLTEEVFELRSQNQWLRRQMVTIMKQVLTTMFSDVLNKKIIDNISSIASPASVANCLKSVKRSYFPGPNKKNEKAQAVRDMETQALARVAAKTFLLSLRPDDLKRFIGSQTTQRGLNTIFEMFQNKTLNTRLIFVLIEGFLKAIFTDKDLKGVLQRMHQQSQRLR